MIFQKERTEKFKTYRKPKPGESSPLRPVPTLVAEVRGFRAVFKDPPTPGASNFKPQIRYEFTFIFKTGKLKFRDFSEGKNRKIQDLPQTQARRKFPRFGG